MRLPACTTCLSAVVLVCAAPVGGQVPFPAAGVDSVFAQYNRTDGPGCALGIYRNGKTVYARGYGMAELNQGIAISPKTTFYIGSTSKQFAAASLMILADQGRLSLDDPVRKFIPELPDYAAEIKLHHLMHHLSGVRDYLGLWAISGRSIGDEIPEEAALDMIARQKALDFQPGSRWSYSNSGYFLISVIEKRASGQSLREYARANIFEPLGMRDTHFHDGGLYTTVEDLAKWDDNFFDNKLAGGGPDFIQRLYTPGVLNSGDTTDYASGLFRHEYRGLPTIDHGGAFIGFRAELLRFPSEHTSVGILCNDYTAAPEAMAHQVADVVLRDRLSAVAASVGSGHAQVPESTLAEYVGRYELMPGVVGSVEREGTGVVLRGLGRSGSLIAVDDSTFTSDFLPGIFVFRRLEDARIALFAPGLGMDQAVPSLSPPPVLSTSDRLDFVGEFYSEELQATYVVKDEEGRLSARGGYGPWIALEPFQPDQFSTGSSKVTVKRDPSGWVTAFRLDAGGIRNVQFVRAR